MPVPYCIVPIFDKPHPYLTNSIENIKVGLLPIFDKYRQTPKLVTAVGVCQYLSNMGPLQYGTGMKYVANNYYMGFVTRVCHIWGVSKIWQIPPIFDKPLYSQLGSEKRKLCSRPMRGLQIDHVTSFRPITRLDFIILKVVRGSPYWNLR